MTPPLSEEQIARIQQRHASDNALWSNDDLDNFAEAFIEAHNDRAALLDHLKALPQTEDLGAAARAPLVEAATVAINNVLLRVVSPSHSALYHLGGYVRWGMIEKELVAAVSEAIAARAPQGINTPPSQKMEDV